MESTSDLYRVLGVARDASKDEIRRAYKKLARKHHPDVNPGNQAAEQRFKELSAAYEVLSDDDKRAAYDEFGEEALKSGFDPEKARAYQRWQSGRQSGGVPFSAEHLDFDLDELFGGAGGGFGGPRGPRPRESAPRDVHAVAELELADAIRGAEISVEVPTESGCSTCAGSGQQPNTRAERCSTCGGSGHRRVARGPLNMVTTCGDCGGRGQRITPCTSCQGVGRVVSTERVRVRIPPGADDGSTLRIPHKGAGGAGGRGDLVIETRVRPHPFVVRAGLDLTLKLPVTVDEAYNGAKVTVPTFDGSVELKIPPRSQSGQKLRLRGRGVTRGGVSGDLFVALDVRMPDVEDEGLARCLSQAGRAYKKPVRSELTL